MKVKITKEVELTETQEHKFQLFQYTQSEFLRTGDEFYSKMAEKQKTYIDRNWDLYQAWKKECGYGV